MHDDGPALSGVIWHFVGYVTNAATAESPSMGIRRWGEEEVKVTHWCTPNTRGHVVASASALLIIGQPHQPCRQRSMPLPRRRILPAHRAYPSQ